MKKEFIENYIARRKRNLKNSAHGASDKLLKERAEEEYFRQRISNPTLDIDFEKRFEEMNQKFKNGDSISDEELSILLNFYRDLEFKLNLLGERFHFAWRDARDAAQRLNDYRKSRLEKRTNIFLET